MKSNGFAGAFPSGSVGMLLIAAGFLLAASQPCLASRATARCTNLEHQLEVVVKAHPGAKATRAAALGAQAHKLCSNARPAMGLRTYVKAFRVLGVEPRLPEE
jgi:hypothetical protein